MQSLGLKMADTRMERQRHWKQASIKAYEAGPEVNVRWLAEQIPDGWHRIPNPYPTTAASLQRGHKIYQYFCIGCHGPIGDGMGPAQPWIYPPPLNFTILKGREISGGILYYQIMNGITGTAMPYFKRDLESQKIWEVGNYVATLFHQSKRCQPGTERHRRGLGAVTDGEEKTTKYAKGAKREVKHPSSTFA